jgi:hypothetical protein
MLSLSWLCITCAALTSNYGRHLEDKEVVPQLLNLPH